MYKIIGADGKEYGPISADQLRQWIAEGRVNATTQILPEGGTEWRPVSAFPEFMASVPVGAPPPTFSLESAPPGAAQGQVTGPAIGLIVVAVLGFLAQAASLVWRLFFAAAMMANRPQVGPFGNMMFSGTVTTISSIIGMLVSGLILFGGLKMQKLENYGLAMAASIVAMIPCISPCCLVGLPIGIWAVVVLSKPEVKNAFH
jgi:hypothetical protein